MKRIRNTRDVLESYYRYIIVGVLFLLLVIILAFFSQKSRKEKAESDEVISMSADVAISTNDIMPTEEPLKINAYPELNALMEKYFVALSSGDIDSLHDICSQIEDDAEKRITVKAKYIEDYEEIVCYTKSGPYPDSYIVFVSYLIKYKDIDTPAPGMSTLLVYRDESGNYYVHNGDIDEPAEKYIKGMVEQNDVIDMLDKIEKDYEDALDNDNALKAFMDTFPARIEADIMNTIKNPEGGEETATEEDREEKEIIIAKDGVRVRSSPDSKDDKNVISTVAKGDRYKQTGTENGWSVIKYKDTVGYIRSDMVSDPEEGNSEGANEKTDGSTIEIVDDGVRVRSTPTTDTENILGSVDNGESFTLIDETDGWYQIEYKGHTGYIKADSGLAKRK